MYQNLIIVGTFNFGMSNISLVKSLASVTSIIFTLSILGFANGHTFSPDESASFISLVDKVKSAAASITSAKNPNSSNVKEQTDYVTSLLTSSVMKEINERNDRIGTKLLNLINALFNGNYNSTSVRDLNDILDEAIAVRVEKKQMANTTVQALAFAIDISEILNNYIMALKPSNNQLINQNAINNSMQAFNTNDNLIVTNMSAFLRALALTNITSERYNNFLKNKSVSTDKTNEIEADLANLLESIKQKVSTKFIMGIVHGEIQPNLQIAFKLKLDHKDTPMGNKSHNKKSILHDTMNM